jgi:cellulose synthase/poly-beta-1,6-N-acetylglucosamine synthase-like glycosyltransferase
MPGNYQGNLVAEGLERVMRLHKLENVGPSMHDDATPPEIPLGMKRFYKYPFIGHLFRFLTWWLIFSGIYASSSVCPFCGQYGCPVGAGSAGIVGGFFALVIGKGKVILSLVTRWFSNIRAIIKSTREGGR